MCRVVTAATSPLKCVWIEPGSKRSIEGFEYAVCRRIPGAERVVNEAECKYCPAWEAAHRSTGTNRATRS
jgi:hypothetical protein